MSGPSHCFESVSHFCRTVSLARGTIPPLLAAPLAAIIAAIKMSHAQRRARAPPALSIAIAVFNASAHLSQPVAAMDLQNQSNNHYLIARVS